MRTPYLSGLDNIQSITTLFAMIVGGALIAGLASRLVRTRGILTAMLLGVSLDTIVLIGLVAAFGVLDADARLWHSLGTIASQTITEDVSDQYHSTLVKDGKEGYIWILGTLYAIGGPAPLLGIGLNIIVHILTVAVVARTTQEIAGAAELAEHHSSRAVLAAGLISAILPCFTIWAPQLLRESLTVFLIAATICSAVAFVRRRRLSSLLVMVGSVAILTWIRQTLGLSIGIAVLSGALFTLMNRGTHVRMLRSALAIAAIPAIPLILQQIMILTDIDAESIVGTTADLSETASSGFPGLGDGTSLAAVFGVTLPRVIAGPFPWEMTTDFVMLLALMDLLCWASVVLTAFLALRYFRNGEHLSRARWLLPLILITGIALTLGLSMITGNYGLLARFRPTATIIFVPLSAIWIAMTKRSVPHRHV